jgi:hypothetical protein
MWTSHQQCHRRHRPYGATEGAMTAVSHDSSCLRKRYAYGYLEIVNITETATPSALQRFIATFERMCSLMSTSAGVDCHCRSWYDQTHLHRANTFEQATKKCFYPFIKFFTHTAHLTVNSTRSTLNEYSQLHRSVETRIRNLHAGLT